MQWHDPVSSPPVLAPLLDCPEYRAELARQATERSMSNPTHAEIIPGSTPAWHVLVTAPNQERTAARHLVDRGFGIYLPEFEKTSICRGVKKPRDLPMFRGYLFVFIWGIEHQWGRLASCPGVLYPLCADGRLIVVPDRIIDHIQAAETELRLHGGVVQRGHLAPAQEKKKRKRRKAKIERKPVDLPEGMSLGPTQEMVTISTRSYFASIGMLDDNQRISLLHVALGLPLQAAPFSTVPPPDWVQGRNSDDAGDLPMRRV